MNIRYRKLEVGTALKCEDRAVMRNRAYTDVELDLAQQTSRPGKVYNGSGSTTYYRLIPIAIKHRKSITKKFMNRWVK